MKPIFCSIITILFICFVNINQSSAQQINPKIQEVFGDHTQVFAQEDPERIKIFTELLNNRLKIIESPVLIEDKYTKLSSVPLLNKYNVNLKRDLVYKAETFNPLKYNLNFFSSKTEIYRIDNTNYIIVITPQSSK